MFSAFSDPLRSRREIVRDKQCLSLIQREERLRILRANVIGPWPNEPVVRVLLEAVRGPAGDAADGEDRGEELDRNPKRVVRGRGVEVHVRVQLLFAGDELLDAPGHVEPARVAGASSSSSPRD